MPGPDASAPLAVDHHLGGRYRLIGPIARGGMAEVWEGYDETLSRPVAVKVLLNHLATDGVVRERFRREAITAARLAHPNVVATYDTGLDAGVAYIVMELVRGPTLRQLLAERGPLPIPVALSIADQIADALAHAQRAGLVHRDIKPANVLITDDDGPLPRIKVTDFGIAKAAERVGVDLTSTGMVLGTPKYLSPEQVEGHEPDARADLYSLGVVLYEMLTGEPPFSGPTEMATALAHLRDPAPRVSARRPATPPAVDQVVARLLAKAPADRYPSATELRRALAGAGPAGGPPGSTPPLGAPPTPPRGWGAAASPGPAAAPRPAAPTGPPLPPVRQPTTGVAAIAGTLGPPGPERNGTRTLAATPTVRQAPARQPTTRTPVAERTAPGRLAAPPDPGPAAAPAVDPRRHRRHRRAPGVVVAVLVVCGAVVAAVLLTRSPAAAPSGQASGGAATAAPFAMSTARVFVLAGHSPDDAAGATNVIDGNPATVWRTDTYANAHFGNLYPGIGVAVELTAGHRLDQMTVTAPSGGWSAEAFVAPSYPTSAASVAVWGAPVGAATATGTTTTLSLGGRSGRWVLLWLTSTGGPPYAAAIGGISIT